MLICAETSGISDGTSVKIKIVEKDDDGNDDDVATITGTVKGGKIEYKWKVIYTMDDDDANNQQELEEKGYTLPEYAFTVEADGVESEESKQLDVKDEIISNIRNFEKLQGRILKLIWKDGSSKEILINNEKLKISDVFIGTACMIIK